MRAKKEGGDLTGPSPVDRGKPGSEMHVLSDANGLPLLVGVTAAATSHSDACTPTRPTTFPTCENGYAVTDRGPYRTEGRRFIADRLGCRGWVIERTMSWLTGYRRLNQRYERPLPVAVLVAS